MRDDTYNSAAFLVFLVFRDLMVPGVRSGNVAPKQAAGALLSHIITSGV